MVRKPQTCFKENVQTHFNDKYLKCFLWNCYQVNATIPHWSLVNIGSSNGLVPSGTWASVDLDPCCHITSLGHNEFIQNKMRMMKILITFKDVSYLCIQSVMHAIVWFCYNAVNFLTNIHKRHPLARPLGWGKGCLLWIRHLFDILQLLMQHLTLLDWLIKALDCI